LVSPFTVTLSCLSHAVANSTSSFHDAVPGMFPDVTPCFDLKA